MYVKIDKLFDVEGTDDGVLYVSSTEGISVGSIINIEWEVQRIEGPELFCRRRSPDEWSEEELKQVINEINTVKH